MTKCPKCGARLKSDYLFCNLCGYRFPERRDETIRSASGNNITAPKIIVDAPRHAPRSFHCQKGPLQHKMVLCFLLTVCAMSPFISWLGVLQSTIGFPAFYSDKFYGQYISLLAIIGMVVVLSERLITDHMQKRIALLLVGMGSIGLAGIDMIFIMNTPDTSLGFMLIMPGVGIYLAIIIGVAIVILALLPHGTEAGTSRTNVGHLVRPGSQG
ncbi:MAG: hypothetical protein E4H30_05905 [Methanomassiliicoccus sp.]|nr:MAG: hypothetical protein E4H30_05905 [Methanomassiliicoccus sp.]